MADSSRKNDQHPPLATATVAAGFPSPADDYLDGGLDLNELLIVRPAATFFVRARGDSMGPDGINDGDLLIVDRSREASDGVIVIAALDGELTVKRLRRRGSQIELVAGNPLYRPIRFGSDATEEGAGSGALCEIWGVVTCVIRQL